MKIFYNLGACSFIKPLVQDGKEVNFESQPLQMYEPVREKTNNLDSDQV